MKVQLAHGSGGKLTRELIENLLLKHFNFSELKQLQDATYIKMKEREIAITTDSYVIKPIVFPGGDIGKLSICGTINDLIVSGAIPEYISVAFIIEEGFGMESLENIVRSMANTASKAGVRIVAGDTKVVEKGKCDSIYINTTGVGTLIKKLSPDNVSTGDIAIVTGYIGDHGVAVSIAREEFEIDIKVESDCAPLNELIQPALKYNIKWMRDPTRGGVATALCELADASKIGIKIYEDKLPIREEVKFICDMLGYDPLYLANEGKALLIVSRQDVENVMQILKNHPLGENATIIGEVTRSFKGVRLITKIGGERQLDMLEDDILPRIC